MAAARESGPGAGMSKSSQFLCSYQVLHVVASLCCTLHPRPPKNGSPGQQFAWIPCQWQARRWAGWPWLVSVQTFANSRATFMPGSTHSLPAPHDSAGPSGISIYEDCQSPHKFVWGVGGAGGEPWWRVLAKGGKSRGVHPLWGLSQTVAVPN